MTPPAPKMPRVGRRRAETATEEDLEVESGFKAPLLKAINATPGLRAWRQQAGSLKVRGGFMVLAPAGAADIVGRAAPDGLHFEVETKGRKTEVKASQDPWAIDTYESGAVYVRARPMKGEPIPDAVRRCVGELLEAIAEARSRRACSAGEAYVAAGCASDASDTAAFSASVNVAGSAALLAAVEGGR